MDRLTTSDRAPHDILPKASIRPAPANGVPAMVALALSALDARPSIRGRNAVCGLNCFVQERRELIRRSIVSVGA